MGKINIIEQKGWAHHSDARGDGRSILGKTKDRKCSKAVMTAAVKVTRVILCSVNMPGISRNGSFVEETGKVRKGGQAERTRGRRSDCDGSFNSRNLFGHKVTWLFLEGVFGKALVKWCENGREDLGSSDAMETGETGVGRSKVKDSTVPEPVDSSEW